MRVAWFRAGPTPTADDTDRSSALIRALAQTVTIEVITEPRAHAFVVEHAQRPYDTCVFELRNAPGSEFIWAYLFHYPGVLLLQDRSLHDSRVRALERHRRSADYVREFAFNHGHRQRAASRPFARGAWPMLRAALHASRLVVVTDEPRRIMLESLYPAVRFRQVPPSAPGPLAPAEFAQTDTRSDVMQVARAESTPVDLLEQAVQRACDAGASLTLTADASPGTSIPTADVVPGVRPEVVVALESPAEDADLTAALAAMALGQVAVVFERESTAGWPALDPQTWRSRTPLVADLPVVVSIDPRDAVHSLMLALKGLAQDAPRRRTIGAAARAWWLAHHTPDHAARVWRQILKDAARTPPPLHPGDWPAHLNVDGAEQARELVADLGIELDDDTVEGHFGISLDAVNGADQKQFVETLGWVFEHSPWVAERAWAHRPFATLEDLHAAMVVELHAARADERLALLRAHPDLGTRARISRASTAEQSATGLDRLTPDEFALLNQLNGEYRARFGFPFLLAVKGSTTHDVITSLSQRVHHPPDAEEAEALRQVARIARFRLDELVT